MTSGCEFLAVRKWWCMSVAWAGWPVGRVIEVCCGMSVTVNRGGASVFGMDCASGGMQGKRRVVSLSEWFYFLCVFLSACVKMSFLERVSVGGYSPKVGEA